MFGKGRVHAVIRFQPSTRGRGFDSPPCLVLAEETWGSGLQTIRSLGSAGAPVLVAVAGRGARIYRTSRYCAGAEDFDPGLPRQFCARVLDWAEQSLAGSGPFPVLPLSDRLVDLLHRSRDLFGPRYRLAIPPPETIELFLDKACSFELAERCGISVPRWVSVGSVGEIAATEDLRLPVVVRPRRWSSTGRRYFKVELFQERVALREGLERLVAAGAQVVVQERVPGRDEAVEWVVFYRSYEGRVSALCTGRKRRQDSPVGGVMVWGESVPIPEARAIAERFVEATGFRGLGGLEVKRVGEDRAFIEFNPRLEAIHFLAARAGVDTVRLAYQDLTAATAPPEPLTQRRATAWVGNAWLGRLERTGDWRTAIADVLRFAVSPRKVFSVWSIRDPIPWLAVMVRLAGRFGARLRGS